MRTALALSEVRHAGAALLAFLAATALDLAGAPALPVVAAYLACYVLGGWEPAVAGLRALAERRLDVDLLMVVAAGAAASIGHWFDGGLLIVIFATSGALESVMTARTRASIDALLDLAPETATVVPDGAEESREHDERRVPAAELVAGQTVLVRPGERIPGDGRVLTGVSEVDTAGLTGEPVPVRRGPGDDVLAGTVNGTGVLRVRVLRDAADSVVAGVAAQVERAAGTKARRQLFVERVEARYSVLVVAATVGLLTVPLLFGAPFEDTLLRAIVFMIVASPCAIVLATMPPLLAALAVAGRRGTLVKDVTVLEALAEVDTVVLDKTGTLTTGRPRVVEVHPLGRWTADEVLVTAAAAEQGSEHVLGRAVRGHALERGLGLPAASGFAAVPGEGVRADVAGRAVQVGRPDPDAAPGEPATALVRGVQEGGRTAVVVVVDGEPAGVVGLSDEPRPGAAEALGGLRRLLGEPEILTGDAPRPARVLGERLGLSTVRAGLLPADKVDAVRARQASGHRVLAAGDGINDAPLLASADVGLVVGEGAGALALEAADGVLTRDPLGSIAPLVELARRARRIARANLALAAAVIVVLVTWDLVGTLPLVVGVAGHELSTVLVCLNGLRLLVGSDRRVAAGPGRGASAGTRDAGRPARAGV
ncbi:heavy metal-(Cd/Co/Hg/Pb/Zn)-translocating P-type ATPase [Pseudonocardia ammonioxydans]|uniref:Heavy metal-(Cd/Co/Hg/Pb/Zn)-translocating P-type ATPase n=1 Tax=Pseudonocardia ammonioxydans TaxID=260086 RepID=A0A1I4SM48_PSUAM|nr:heavy metal translocating P-type ATPase [Pseudonocardia ammonioxydans]SFM65556.1 heavy metal-(Cd/Co/Hg/Pb/Zn)-translocating P-type ATPase [Pseudonocardia ammonioxydans]